MIYKGEELGGQGEGELYWKVEVEEVFLGGLGRFGFCGLFLLFGDNKDKESS